MTGNSRWLFKIYIQDRKEIQFILLGIQETKYILQYVITEGNSVWEAKSRRVIVYHDRFKKFYLFISFWGGFIVVSYDPDLR